MWDEAREIEKQKRKESYTRLCMEVILRAFNNILSSEYYQYHTTKYLRNKDHNSMVILKKHHDAIHWFLNERESVWFEYLEIKLTQKQMIQAIHIKFNSPKKFNKYYASFAASTGVEINDS